MAAWQQDSEQFIQAGSLLTWEERFKETGREVCAGGGSEGQMKYVQLEMNHGCKKEVQVKVGNQSTGGIELGRD